MDNVSEPHHSKNKAFHHRLRFALAGIHHALSAERSFQIHIVATAAIIVALLILRPPAVWWALVALSVGAVLAAELFNTALEILADHLHPDQHPQIKRVKDCAAAAVLVTSLAALGVAAALAWYCAGILL